MGSNAAGQLNGIRAGLFDRGIPQHILSISPTEDVGIFSSSPFQYIGTRSAIELIRPVLAKEQIVPVLSTQNICSQAAEDDVITSTPRDAITQSRACQCVRTRRSIDLDALFQQFINRQRRAVGKLQPID